MFPLLSLFVLGLLLLLLEVAPRNRFKEFVGNLISTDHDRLEGERGSHAVAIVA